MAKYTNEELKEMALEFVRDKNMGGMRALQLILTMSAMTGLDPDIVMARIDALARS